MWPILEKNILVMSIPQNLKENRLQLKFCSALLLRLPAISLPLRPPLRSTVPLHPSLVHTVTNRRLLPHPLRHRGAFSAHFRSSLPVTTRDELASCNHLDCRVPGPVCIYPSLASSFALLTAFHSFIGTLLRSSMDS